MKYSTIVLINIICAAIIILAGSNKKVDNNKNSEYSKDNTKGDKHDYN